MPELPMTMPSAKLSQEEQKLVERARNILMHQRDLTETQAYSLLSEMADKRKTGMVAMSRQLISLTSHLTA
ncbi:ANTAR domain-containing protein [Methylophilus rhizosphaerae]|uniref:ANTAR domain-containing protein n=1 Tax=Methylophilus rhizosphaerae TaxID=492660 RepID=UPI000B805018|nr:ANTAR domain-containing protein [Methylophilus rhizosphaerae]